MTHKKIILGLAAVLVVGGCVSAVAMSPLWNSQDPEAPLYERLFQTGKMKGADIDALSQVQAQQKAAANLTPGQQAAQLSQSFAKFQADQAAHPAATVAPTVSAKPFSGILKPQDAPMPPFGYHDFRTYGYWGGTVNGQDVGVFAGATQNNPQQGVVLVSDSSNAPGATPYSAPSGTGPLEIVSVSGNVLTLRSVAATLDVYDDNGNHKTVSAKGGVTYKFDVAKRIFTQ